MEEKKVKKKYSKPQVEEVQLKAEEAVLASCKVLQLGGPFGSQNCRKKVGGNPCFNPAGS